jgi:hypothetical protein
MGRLLFVLLLSGSFLLAQDNNPSAASQNNSKGSNGQITVDGCVDRSRGDYVLIQQDPGMTYQLQGTGKIKINKYFGQRVEVTGTKQSSLSTSSDSLAVGGSPSPVTVRVDSIKTLAKQCSAHQVSK